MYFDIQFPDTKTLERIVASKIEGYSKKEIEQVVAHFKKTRESDQPKLRKKPATAELILWAAVLIRMGFPAGKLRNTGHLNSAEKEMLGSSYSVLAKNRDDLKALNESI